MISRAVGCVRRTRRIAWRAWRSASAVTAQVLTKTASARPAAAACARITSDSKALRRQPKVMISGADNALSQRRRVERAGKAHRHRPGHEDVAVLAPVDLERAAVEDHLGLAPGEPAARGTHQRGAGAAAAGDGDAGAALPDAKAQPRLRQHLGDADIGPLGKQRIALEPGAERRQIDRLGV